MVLVYHVGSQVHELPTLWCETDGTPLSTTKTGVRQFLENRYAACIKPVYQLDKDTCLMIRDSMQDIQLEPKNRNPTFGEYFHLFWTVKIKSSFIRCNAVCLLFVKQNRTNSVKDLTRAKRDDTAAGNCPDIKDISMQTVIPTDYNWSAFLANRHNKMCLVRFLVAQILTEGHTLLNEGQTLFVNDEDDGWKICSGAPPTPFLPLSSCQEEADTRMFFAVTVLDSYESYLVRSTDSDVLFVACINETKFRNKNVVIQYNTASSSARYVSCDELFKAIDDDIDPLMSMARNQGQSFVQMFGIIHYVAGSDYLPYFRNISKNKVCHALIKYMDFIFPSHMKPEYLYNADTSTLEDIYRFYARLISAAFRYVYSTCFSSNESLDDLISRPDGGGESHSMLIEVIREKTWHRTVVDQNTVPTMEAINFNSMRCTYVLNQIHNVSILFQNFIDPTLWAWDRITLMAPLC